MKLSCLQENLALGLNQVKRAVATRSILPVLSNVMLSTDNGRLKLSATDLEIGINCWIGAKVEEDGATTVPARTFIDLVNSLPPEVIDLELVKKTETLKLKCGRTKANFKGISAEEFPLIPVAENTMPINADLFQEMVKQVSIAAAKDESRPVLTGILLKFEQGKLTLAAADGFRLSVRSVEVPGEDKSVIIPARALVGAARLECTGLQLNEGQAIFQGEDFNLVAQLINGNFPDYNQIIPTESKTEVRIDTTSFLSACKRAWIFAREAIDFAKLEVEPDNVRIVSTSAESGDSRDNVLATVTGEPLSIGLNVKYLIEALSVMPTGRTILKMSGPAGPIVMKSDDEGLDFIHVIMPMSIRQ